MLLKPRSCGLVLYCDIPFLSTSIKVINTSIPHGTRNMGVIIDSQLLSLSAHVALLCRAGYYQLRPPAMTSHPITFNRNCEDTGPDVRERADCHPLAPCFAEKLGHRARGWLRRIYILLAKHPNILADLKLAKLKFSGS